MKESKVKPDQYVVLQGWMLSDLKLKGNELIIYACIYGFSQAESQVFNGSLQYLADWTNSTKQGVLRCLKSLIEKGLIAKNEKLINGVKFCEYRATKLNTVCNKSEYGIKQSLIPPIQQSLPNNLSLDNLSNKTKDIISYLNAKAGTNYRASSKATQQHINARFAEGYKVEDFKTVIDKKCAEWLGSDFEQYLRPSTLFGSKFENYLNSRLQNRGKNGIAVSSCQSDLDGVF